MKYVLCLIVLLAVALAGCSGGGDTTVIKEQPAKEQSAPPAEPAHYPPYMQRAFMDACGYTSYCRCVLRYMEANYTVGAVIAFDKADLNRVVREAYGECG